ncbi:hypothetical protein [Nibrella saemangeumensis]|uniref:hypothetical protein n=1 Tax=Nibrella saemangeumensis TaxID=1084526 RepID=UPI0031ED1A68
MAKVAQGDWNEPSSLVEDYSLVLDFINSESELRERLDFYDKLYYENLPRHFSLSFEQISLIGDLINIPLENYREFYKYWPNKLDNKLFIALRDKLKLRFASALQIGNELHHNYYLIYNYNFWFKSRDIDFANDSIDTFERSFLMEEMCFENLKEAEIFRTLITSRLWSTRRPDNRYYFKERLLEELNNSLSSIQTIFTSPKDTVNTLIPKDFWDFNMRYSNEYALSSIEHKDEKIKQVKLEYWKVYEEHKSQIDEYIKVFNIVQNPPLLIQRAS